MARLASQPNIGDGITVHGWSDSQAFTVIKLIGTTGFIAQRDKATRTNRDADTFSPGGFAGHTSTNGHQEWAYEANPDGTTVKVTRRRTPAGFVWKPVGSGTKPVSYGRYEHYDYNF